MKTIVATAIFALGLAFAPAQASTHMSMPETNTAKQSKPTDQANCSFTYRRECNGYCWVCY